MKQGEYEIHANPGKVFDCACKVGVECDVETIALRFPQIDRDDDNIGPMVYAHMRGTELRVTLCDRENSDIEFRWDEGDNVWRACGAANKLLSGFQLSSPLVEIVYQKDKSVNSIQNAVIHASGLSCGL